MIIVDIKNNFCVTSFIEARAFGRILYFKQNLLAYYIIPINCEDEYPEIVFV